MTRDEEEHAGERVELYGENDGGVTTGEEGGSREEEVPEPDVGSADIAGWGEDDWRVSDSETEDRGAEEEKKRSGRPVPNVEDIEADVY